MDPSQLIQSSYYSKVFGIVLGENKDNEDLEALPRKRCKCVEVMYYKLMYHYIVIVHV